MTEWRARSASNRAAQRPPCSRSYPRTTRHRRRCLQLAPRTELRAATSGTRYGPACTRSYPRATRHGSNDAEHTRPCRDNPCRQTVPRRDRFVPACTRELPGTGAHTCKTCALRGLRYSHAVPGTHPLVPARTRELPGTVRFASVALRTRGTRRQIRPSVRSDHHHCRFPNRRNGQSRRPSYRPNLMIDQNHRCDQRSRRRPTASGSRSSCASRRRSALPLVGSTSRASRCR